VTLVAARQLDDLQVGHRRDVLELGTILVVRAGVDRDLVLASAPLPGPRHHGRRVARARDHGPVTGVPRPAKGSAAPTWSRWAPAPAGRARRARHGSRRPTFRARTCPARGPRRSSRAG